MNKIIYRSEYYILLKIADKYEKNALRVFLSKDIFNVEIDKNAFIVNNQIYQWIEPVKINIYLNF